MPAEPIGEMELSAWIDGELDLAHRFAIEDRLARDPAAAAAVMGDLARRSALRLTVGADGPSPAALDEAGERLAQTLATPRAVYRHAAWVGGGAAVAAALLLAVGPGRSVRDEPPAYVEDAVAAYRTGLLRATMPSQVETPVLDAAEIRRTMRIRLPTLLPGWRVTDVQVFPSDEGPSLQIMVTTPERHRLSLFAVRTDSHAPAEPETVRVGRTSAAFWRDRDMSYAVIGAGAPRQIDPLAERLADGEVG